MTAKVNKKIIAWIGWALLFFGFLLCAIIVSFCIGSVVIPLDKIFQIIFNGRGTQEYSILFNDRLPRIILGFGIGSALSLAGALLQGIFRNPLVEPYTLGIAGCAALGVCFNIIFRLHHLVGIFTLPFSGFSGALLAVILIYVLSHKKGIIKIKNILLLGVMISFISSSLIMFLMSISKTENLHGIIFWTMGSLGETNRILVSLAPIAAFLGLIVAYIFSINLNALSLGEEEAFYLGISVERTKLVLFIVASLLTGLSVSIAGIIGFVGLVVPHFVRMIVGRDHRVLLICSFFGGAGFLLICDTVARTVISPLELPVGAITGIIGGTILIYVLSKKQVVL